MSEVVGQPPDNPIPAEAAEAVKLALCGVSELPHPGYYDRLTEAALTAAEKVRLTAEVNAGNSTKAAVAAARIREARTPADKQATGITPDRGFAGYPYEAERQVIAAEKVLATQPPQSRVASNTQPETGPTPSSIRAEEQARIITLIEGMVHEPSRDENGDQSYGYGLGIRAALSAINEGSEG